MRNPSVVALFWWEETVVFVQREEKDVRTNRKTPTRKGSISQRELPNKTYSLQRFSSSPLITRSCARNCYKNRNKIIEDFEKSIEIY